MNDLKKDLKRRRSRINETYFTLIREAISDGSKSVREIERKTALKKNSIYYYASVGKITLPKFKSCATDIIKEVITDGADTITKIREKTGYSWPTIMKYGMKDMVDNGVYFTTKKNSSKELSMKINFILQSGEKSLEQLCKKAHMGPASLMKIVQENDIVLPEGLVPWRRNPDIDKYIDSDETPGLVLIGKNVGLTSERIRKYIIESGQGRIYKQKRKKQTKKFKKQEKKLIIGDIAMILHGRMRQLAKQEGWEYEKALEYAESRSHWHVDGNRTIDKLAGFFKKYEDAKKSGQKLSLQKLSEGTIYWPAAASFILSHVGLEPLIRKVNRHTIVEYKKEAMKRSADTEMSTVDMAYFLDIGKQNFFQNWKLWGIGQKNPKEKKYLKKFGNTGNHLTFRRASEIYEGIDLCGFKRDQVAEILGIPTKIVDYTIDNRKDIELKIIDGLRILYGNSEINKPYKIKF